MPLDDPLGISGPAPIAATIAAPIAAAHTRLSGPLTDDHAQHVEDRLYQAAVGVVLEQTVDSPAGVTVTRSERAPDVKAALAVLTTLRPARWRDDRPVTAIQFVMHLPAVSTDSQAWLRDIGRGGPVIDGQAVPQVQADRPGGLVPTASGPVPDPLAVPIAHSPMTVSGAEKIKKA